MAGNRIGGLKTAAKNLANNPTFYSDIGRIGGRNGHTGGFTDRDLARRAGRLGGLISRKPKRIPLNSELKKEMQVV